MINVVCPNCGSRLQVPEKYSGQRGSCRKCGGNLVVPLQSSVSDTGTKSAFRQVETDNPAQSSDPRPILGRHSRPILVAAVSGVSLLAFSLAWILFGDKGNEESYDPTINPIPVAQLDGGNELPPAHMREQGATVVEVDIRRRSFDSPRKGSLALALRTPDGAPWSHATVDYTQTSHDFLFGVGMTSPTGPVPWHVFEELREIGVNYALPYVTWSVVQPEPGFFDWRGLDDYFRPNSMRQLGYVLNGHCMIFFMDASHCLPSYAKAMTFEELRRAIPSHVSELVRRYKGTISYWTINEPMFTHGDFFRLTKAQWTTIVDIAVKAVRRVDPEARIMINLIPNDHPTGDYSPYDTLDRLIAHGIEFEVIGLELYPVMASRKDENGYPDIGWASEMLDSYIRFGKPIILSEVGVSDTPSQETQAAWLTAFYAMAFERLQVAGITWLFLDDNDFLPGSGLMPTFDSPPRRAYRALAEVIKNRTTKGTATTDSTGTARIVGYAGDYRIDVRDADRTASFVVHISEGKERLIML